jgi:hypothetical protein
MSIPGQHRHSVHADAASHKLHQTFSDVGDNLNTLGKSISSFVCIGAITKKQLLIGMNIVFFKTDI